MTLCPIHYIDEDLCGCSDSPPGLLLLDTFVDNKSPSFVEGTLSDIGPGKRDVVTDTEDLVSVKDGGLSVESGKTIPAWGNPGIWWTASSGVAFSRFAGRILLMNFVSSNINDFEFGFDDNQNGRLEANSFLLSSSDLYSKNTTTQSPLLTSLSNDTEYILYVMLRDNGAYYLINGGEFGNRPILISVGDNNNSNPIYPSISNFDSNIEAAKVALYDIPVISANVSDTFYYKTTNDIGANSLDGLYVRVGLDGAKSYYDGLKSYTFLTNTIIDAVFDQDEFSVISKQQVSSPSIWIDGKLHVIFNFNSGVSNSIYMYNDSVNDTLVTAYTTAGITKKISTFFVTTTDEFTLGMNVSLSADVSGEHTSYFNGVKSGLTLRGLSNYVGALSTTIFGASTVSGIDGWSGSIGDTIITLNSVVLSSAEQTIIADALLADTLTTAQLDSIAGVGNWAWWDNGERHISDGLVTPIDIGGSGYGYEWLGSRHSTAANISYISATNYSDFSQTLASIKPTETEFNNVLMKSSFTITAGENGGFVLNLDDNDNPQNFVLVYYNNLDAKIYIDKYIGGILTNVDSVAAVYSVGGELEVWKLGSTYRVTYDGTTVLESTIADTEIINNVLHGHYASDNSTYCENLIMWNVDR